MTVPKNVKIETDMGFKKRFIITFLYFCSKAFHNRKPVTVHD